MRKTIPYFSLLILMVSLVSADTVAVSSIETKIMEKIKKNDPICSTCNLVVQKNSSPWLKDFEIFQVTTFDILPPPAWHFAVKKDQIYSLDRRNLKDWNQVIVSQNLSLDSDSRVIDYLKFFLSTTMNQSQFIEKLTPGEINRIEEKESKKVETAIKIVRSNDKIQAVFYANDLQGDLQEWNLVLAKTGEILKLQQRSF